MDDISAFSSGGSSDYVPVKPTKAPKARAAPKKPTGPAKPRGRPPKDAQAAKPKPKPKPKAAPKKKRKDDSEDDENSDVDIDEDPPDDGDGDMMLADTPPKAKKPQGPKRTSGKPLADVTGDVDDADDALVPAPAANANQGGTSSKYQMLTHLEHIMKRPDTYIGSVEQMTDKMWVFNSTTESMEYREVSYVPGLYKIFDEILVNAADNKQNDKNMSEIRVTVDRESGEISVRNDGRGIPIEIHKEHGIYVPEMIFGHLLTSSNYDDNQHKVTGGRNGYGAKLCNVFSTEFTLETVDSRQKKKYKQTWTDNMSKMGKAKITDIKADDYTKVSYKADFGKFQMDGIDDDFEALVKRRTYDMAGTLKGIKVYLNGERIKCRNFAQYMEMYTKSIANEQGRTEEDKQKDVILTDKHDRWEVGFAVSDGAFNQVSFVNSIATSSGGTHVNFVADQIIERLLATVNKKNKGGFKLKPAQIKNHIFLFVNCQIVNPAFTSQTKEQLTTKNSQFGSKPTLSDKFLKQIEKTDVIQNIMHFAQQKADQLLKKSDGSKRSRMNNSKLTEANRAGTKDGHRCILILTEGDSATPLALAGRAVVDPDLIGVFPLRGKLLNVRDASIDQISKNVEIQNIKKFMGLQHKKEYTDTKGLRYGSIMIMTDQDHDGSHIKGLLINFFQCQFPSLLKLPGFLLEFITPIVKVWKGDPKNPRGLRNFFSMPEWEEWKELHKNERGWDHKYYKGLGTSSTDDAQIYFKDPDTHMKGFSIMKSEEESLIELAFSKKKADARKEWLRDFRPGNHLDLTTKEISYHDFINKELILFSIADNQRSIPSVVDGFKTGQRKVIYTCLRRNIKKDVKVVDLAGSVSGTTDYAYGDASLQGTITGLAQTFVGSNNVNFLEPSGNFGSRLQGGADAASARYIYTRLTPFARKVFHNYDDALLTYGESDGNKIEPETYIPIIPMVLVNGADGIGTGWSSSIPNYNPVDIVENLRIRMQNGNSKEDMKPMVPWFRGFTGTTEEMGPDRFKFTGTVRQTGDNEVEVTELPVRLWTQDFKERLEDIIKAEKAPSFIKDYSEYNTPTKVHFVIKMEDKHMANAVAKGLEETFKLYKTMATSNLVAFDSQGRIHKYATPLDIMEEFYHVRLHYYEKRKQYQLDELQKDLDKLSNQSRFIQMIIDGKLVVSKKKKAALVAELKKLNFKPFPKVSEAKRAGELEEAQEDDGDESDNEPGMNDYDYLLGMAIWSLTQERVEKLLKQIGDKEAEVDALIKLSPKDLWARDLDAFVEEWDLQLDEEKKHAKKIAGMSRRVSARFGGGTKGKKKKRKMGDSDSDDSDGDFGPVNKRAKAAKPKAGGLLGYLKKEEPKKPSATAALKGGAASKTTASKSNMLDYLVKNGKEPTPAADDAMDVDEPAPAAPAADPPKKKGRPAGSKNVSKKEQPASSRAPVTVDSDDDSDVSAAVAKEAAKKPAETTTTSRAPRGATKKAPKYTLDDDSDSDDMGDDLLGDVSSMVKTVGGGSNDRPLFHSRPGSGSGGGAAATRPDSAAGATTSKALGTSNKKSSSSELDGDPDETNYEGLMPQPSPKKPAPRNVTDTIMGADSDDDDDFGFNAKSTKPATKPAAKPAPKPKATSKAAAAPKPTTVVAKKSTQLSPAAKAYAARLGKSKEAAVSKPTAKAKKPIAVDSDDDMEDADQLANDILSDKDDDDDDDDEPTPKPAARPGRRAAAARKPARYVEIDDEDDDEEEESEPDFDEDSE